MTRIVIVIGILVLLVALLLPYFQVAVWDGKFDLTINLSAPLQDEQGVAFAPCWNEAEAELAMQQANNREIPFQYGKLKSPTQRTVQVPCSGRRNSLGFETFYIEPKYIVVKFATADNPDAVQTARLAMPPGRGPRSVTLSVPPEFAQTEVPEFGAPSK